MSTQPHGLVIDLGEWPGARERPLARDLDPAPLAPPAAARRRRGSLVGRVLLVADVFGLVVSFIVAALVFGPSADLSDRFGPTIEFVAFLATLPAWVLIAKLYGLYDRDDERADHTTFDDFRGVFHLLTTGSWLVVGAVWIAGFAEPDMRKLTLFWGLAIVLVTVARACGRVLCRRNAAFLQNTLVLGAGVVGQRVARKVLQHPEYGLNVVGFVDAAPKEREDGLADLAVLGTPDDLPRLVRTFGVERVIVAFSNEPHDETLRLIRSLRDLDVRVDVVPRLFEAMGPSYAAHAVEGLPLIGLPASELSRSSRLLKRGMDVCLSGLGLALLAPLFALVALAIRVDSPGPVSFRQVRVGADGRRFRILKFRTMVANAEELKADVAHLNRHARSGGDPRMFKIVDDPRVTRVGSVLRRYFLDELPQLINVFTGQMSLVGPRPLILDEAQHVGEWARARLDLKPGMTGRWQVLGRSAIGFEEMVSLDYVYVTQWSLWQDLRLLFATIPLALRGEGQRG